MAETEVSRLVYKVVADTVTATRSLTGFIGRVSGMSSVLRGLFERIGHRITDALIRLPMRAFRQLQQQVSAAITDARQFETALAEVATLGVQDMDKLRHGIEDVAMALGTDIVDNTRAVYQALSASIPEENVLTFLETAAKGAKAGLTDTKTSVDALSSIINAYRLQAEQATYVSDLYFQTIKLGKTRYEELASSIGRLAPVAKASNVELEEMFGLIAALTRVGIKTDEAITGIRAILMQLLRPMAEAEDLLKQMGYDAANMERHIGEEGLMGVLRRIDQAGHLKAILGNIRALNPALALVAEGGALANEVLAGMGEAAGATEEAFGKVANTFDTAWGRMRAILRTVRQTVVQPFLEAGADIVNAIADWFGTGFTEQERRVLGGMGIEVPEGGGRQIIEQIRRWAEQTATQISETLGAVLKGEKPFSEVIAEWFGSIDDLITRLRASPAYQKAIEVLSEAVTDIFTEAMNRAGPAIWDKWMELLMTYPQRLFGLPQWARPPNIADIDWLLGGQVEFDEAQLPPTRGAKSAGGIVVNVYGEGKSTPEIARQVVREINRTRRASPAFAGTF